jgi:DNA-directed RNA polymerase subunit RPC12/RpoP
MATQEYFTCGSCSYKVLVDWKDGEGDGKSRDIPCPNCFWEEWVCTQTPTPCRFNPNCASPNQAVTTKITHGNIC